MQGSEAENRNGQGEQRGARESENSDEGRDTDQYTSNRNSVEKTSEEQKRGGRIS